MGLVRVLHHDIMLLFLLMKDHLTHSQILLTNLTINPKVKTVEIKKNWGMPPSSQHFGGIGVCWSSGMEIKV